MSFLGNAFFVCFKEASCPAWSLMQGLKSRPWDWELSWKQESDTPLNDSPSCTPCPQDILIKFYVVHSFPSLSLVFHFTPLLTSSLPTNIHCIQAPCYGPLNTTSCASRALVFQIKPAHSNFLLLRMKFCQRWHLLFSALSNLTQDSVQTLFCSMDISLGLQKVNPISLLTMSVVTLPCFMEIVLAKGLGHSRWTPDTYTYTFRQVPWPAHPHSRTQMAEDRASLVTVRSYQTRCPLRTSVFSCTEGERWK